MLVDKPWPVLLVSGAASTPLEFTALGALARGSWVRLLAALLCQAALAVGVHFVRPVGVSPTVLLTLALGPVEWSPGSPSARLGFSALLVEASA